MRVEAFQRELLSFPELPQELDPDSPHFLVTSFLQQSIPTHFPVQKRRPRKPQLEPSTFALVEQRQYWRSTASAQGRYLRTVALATHFLVWKLTIFASEQQHAHEQLSEWERGMNFALQTLARAVQHADKLLASARAAARADKHSFVNGVVNSAAKAAEAGSIKGLYAAVRQLKRKPQRTPQLIQLEDGSLAQSPEQVAKRWQRYFADQMSGKVVPLYDLAAPSRQRRAERGETLALRVLPPSQIVGHASQHQPWASNWRGFYPC